RGYDTNDAVKIVDTLMKSDFNVIEVALNSPNAKNTLKTLKKEFGKDLILGAGTVLTVEEAEYCVKIGVEFILSPVFSKEVLKFAIEEDILYIPGCYTPTEIYNAKLLGAKMIKVFPASQLQASYIKDVLAPMNDLVLLPTGGIKPGNINEFLDVGAKAVGINSALVPSKRKVDETMLNDVHERANAIKETMKI